MIRCCLFLLPLLSALLACPPRAAAQASPTAPAELLPQLERHGQAMVRALRAVCQQPDDARAAALLEELVAALGPFSQQLRAQSGTLTPAQREQLSRQMQQQAWLPEFRALVASGALTALEQRAARHAALGAAYARFTEAGILGRTPHSSPAGSAPTP